MINWHLIDTVLLDMDGTLLDLHFDNHFWQEHVPKRYAESRGLDVPTAKILLAGIFKKAEGSLNWYCLDYWSRELQLDIAELKREVVDLIALRPDSIQFLNWLRAQGKRTVLVTNAHRKSLALKLERTQLEQYVDELVCSHDFGMSKETPTFWIHLQRHLLFNPASTVFIDDSMPVLAAAKAYGIEVVIAITNPSSQLAPKLINEFLAISNFDQLIS